MLVMDETSRYIWFQSKADLVFDRNDISRHNSKKTTRKQRKKNTSLHLCCFRFILFCFICTFNHKKFQFRHKYFFFVGRVAFVNINSRQQHQSTNQSVLLRNVEPCSSFNAYSSTTNRDSKCSSETQNHSPTMHDKLSKKSLYRNKRFARIHKFFQRWLFESQTFYLLRCKK